MAKFCCGSHLVKRVLFSALVWSSQVDQNASLCAVQALNWSFFTKEKTVPATKKVPLSETNDLLEKLTAASGDILPEIQKSQELFPKSAAKLQELYPQGPYNREHLMQLSPLWKEIKKVEEKRKPILRELDDAKLKYWSSEDGKKRKEGALQMKAFLKDRKKLKLSDGVWRIRALASVLAMMDSMSAEHAEWKLANLRRKLQPLNARLNELQPKADEELAKKLEKFIHPLHDKEHLISQCPSWEEIKKVVELRKQVLRLLDELASAKYWETEEGKRASTDFGAALKSTLHASKLGLLRSPDDIKLGIAFVSFAAPVVARTEIALEDEVEETLKRLRRGLETVDAELNELQQSFDQELKQVLENWEKSEGTTHPKGNDGDEASSNKAKRPAPIL
ncbi:unnamed protein product [Amoebophrya sp. A120]|nr:unnamed protein product [Amoebophrya sp. A120]|eukprot:GSA120T00007164001.1